MIAFESPDCGVLVQVLVDPEQIESIEVWTPPEGNTSMGVIRTKTGARWPVTAEEAKRVARASDETLENDPAAAWWLR